MRNIQILSHSKRLNATFSISDRIRRHTHTERILKIGKIQ